MQLSSWLKSAKLYPTLRVEDLGSASIHILPAEGGPHNALWVRTALEAKAVAVQLQDNPNAEKAAKLIGLRIKTWL